MAKTKNKTPTKKKQVANDTDSPITAIANDKTVKGVRKFFSKKIRSVVKELKRPKVSVLRLQGVIGEIGMKQGLTLDSLEDDIKKAFDVKGVKAVALVVNSPGGSPVQSELLQNRIRALSVEKKIPVFAFAEDVAASGGYWLICAGEEIYAMNSSIVGSLGVISSGFGFVDAMKKMGVERRVYTQGKNKSLLDPFQKEKPTDVKILTNAQKDCHDAFMDMVKTRRKGKLKKINEAIIFTGEFWSGKRAKELGLVDEIGHVHDVMQKKYGKEVKLIPITKPKSWFKRKFLGANLVSSFYGVMVERDLWGRYGL